MARRRSQLRRKKGTSHKQNVMYLLILILLIVFFATICFRLVINAAIWVSGISKESSSVTREEDDRSFLLAPELYDVPDATNSARLPVSGRGSENTTLTVYLNGEDAEKIELDSDEFETELVLNEGENTIFLEVRNEKKKQAKDSETYTVYLLTEKPRLDISSPQDGDTRDKAQVTVQGETDKDVSVRINNTPVIVTTQGAFQKNVRLKEGENTLTIRAIDIAGNTTETELKVTYNKDE